MKVKKGDRITVSKHPDATWYTVVSVKGWQVEIQEKDLYRTQFIDKSLIKACVKGR